MGARPSDRVWAQAWDYSTGAPPGTGRAAVAAASRPARDSALGGRAVSEAPGGGCAGATSRYLASRQFSPTPMCTSSGGSIS